MANKILGNIPAHKLRQPATIPLPKPPASRNFPPQAWGRARPLPNPKGASPPVIYPRDFARWLQQMVERGVMTPVPMTAPAPSPHQNLSRGRATRGNPQPILQAKPTLQSILPLRPEPRVQAAGSLWIRTGAILSNTGPKTPAIPKGTRKRVLSSGGPADEQAPPQRTLFPRDMYPATPARITRFWRDLAWEVPRSPTSDGGHQAPLARAWKPWK